MICEKLQLRNIICIISHITCAVCDFLQTENIHKRQKLLTSSVMSMISPTLSSSSSSFRGTYSNRALHWRFLASVMKTY